MRAIFKDEKSKIENENIYKENYYQSKIGLEKLSEKNFRFKSEYEALINNELLLESMQD